LCRTIEVALETHPVIVRERGMKNRMIFIVTALLFCSGVIAAQPSLQVSIHIPTMSVDPAAEAYLPHPIPVTVTIYNTGTAASQPLRARISFPPDLELADTEQHAIIKNPSPRSCNRMIPSRSHGC
jgi:hypothetical protein